MEIKNIQITNLLSFNNFFLDLKKFSFLVGPNNSGKTNIVRIIKLIQDIIQNTSQFRLEDILNRYVRKNASDKSFEVIIQIKFKASEMAILKNYFFYFGEIQAEKIRNLDINPIINSFKNQDHKQTIHDIIEKLGQNFFRAKTSEIFLEIWNEIVDSLIEFIFPNNEIKLIWKYKEKYGKRAEFSLKFLNYFINFEGYIGHDYDLRSYVPKEIDRQYIEDVFSIITKQKLMNKKFITHNNKNELKRNIISTFRKINDNEMVKFNLDFDRVQIVQEKLFLDMKKNFGFGENINDRSISLTNIICKWFAQNLITTDNIRYFPPINTLSDFIIKKLTSPYLSSILYDLKNSKYAEDRVRFNKIRTLFFDITNYYFDVISSIEEYKVDETHNNIGGTLDIVISPKIDFSDQFSIEYTGSGFYEILYLLTIIISSKIQFIILDEPAINLHPMWQKKILHNILGQDDKQVLLITHSPYLLPDLTNIKNNYLIHHFQLEPETQTTNRLRLNITKKIKKYMKIIEKRKNIFFSNFIVLVEGPSDERIIGEIINILQEKDKILTNSNIEIVNMNGAPQCIEIFKILIDWKMPVILILDHDSKSLLLQLSRLKKYKNNIKYIILLPSDIEGTITIGDFLNTIKEIVTEKYYLLNEKFLKFKKNDDPAINSMIKLLNQFKKTDIKRFNSLLQNILKKTIPIKYYRIRYRKYKKELEENVLKAISNLKQYQKEKCHQMREEDRAIYITNNRIIKILESNKIISESIKLLHELRTSNLKM